MNIMNNCCLPGVFTHGSPCLSVFEAKGEKSAVAQAAAAGFNHLIITDTTIGVRAVNEAAAKAYGVKIRQGWIVQTFSEDGIKPCLLTLFPAALPEISEGLFAKWSAKYPLEPLDPLSILPFGERQPMPLFTKIPLAEIIANKDSLLIFNSTLEGNTTIPYREELLDLYQGFFIRFDGTYKASSKQLRKLKSLRRNAKFLPHFHIGSMVRNQWDVKCLRDILENRVFPVPDSMEQISMTEFQELYGLLTSGDDFFADTPHIEITSALIPGANISADYQAVEIVPEDLRPSEKQQEKLLLEIREICTEKLKKMYADEDLDYGIEVLNDELRLIYDERYQGYMYGQALLMLYKVLLAIDRECCVLVKHFNHCPLISFLFGLSRYNPLSDITESQVSTDIIISMNFLQLETSVDTYRLIHQKFLEMYPEIAAAEVAEEQTAWELLEKSANSCQFLNTMQDLGYEEKESLRNAVVGFRQSTNSNHNIIIVPEGMQLPGIRIDNAALPVVTPSFCYLASVLVMNITFNCSETIARFERVNEKVLKKYIPKITKTVEKQIFEKFLPGIDRVMAAGIPELTPLIRKLIRETKPGNRYALTAILCKHFLDGDYYMDFKYHLQLVDIIISMLTASLSHPEEYFEAIDQKDHDLEWYPEAVLERMVYEPIINGVIDEYTEALLIDNGIPTEHFLRETANKDRPLIKYASRKRYYPELLLE